MQVSADVVEFFYGACVSVGIDFDMDDAHEAAWGVLELHSAGHGLNVRQREPQVFALSRILHERRFSMGVESGSRIVKLVHAVIIKI